MLAKGHPRTEPVSLHSGATAPGQMCSGAGRRASLNRGRVLAADSLCAGGSPRASPAQPTPLSTPGFPGFFVLTPSSWEGVTLRFPCSVLWGPGAGQEYTPAWPLEIPQPLLYVSLHLCTFISLNRIQVRRPIHRMLESRSLFR